MSLFRLPWIRRISIGILLAIPPVQAQQPASGPTPKFKASSELVTVPVIVLSHGKHVNGLRQADFTVEEDGEQKPISTFEDIVSSGTAVKNIDSPPGIYTNEVVPGRPTNVVVIALDLINTPYLYQAPVRAKLLEYLKRSYRADRPTLLAVLHPAGLRIVHDFTSDPRVLEELVHNLSNRMKHDPAADETPDSQLPGALLKPIDIAAEYKVLDDEFFAANEQGLEAYRQRAAANDLELTFAELQELSHALASVPGMKTLVWAFGGITFPKSMDSRSRLTQVYEDTLRLMDSSGIVVAAVDTYLETDNPAFAGAMNQLPVRGTRGSIQRVQNFMDIAERTGGDYCLMRRDSDCFSKMADYGSQYYLLTFYTEPTNKSRWRKLRVRVNGEGYEVRARNGYFSAGSENNDERRKRDIAQAFAAPVEYRGLAVSVRWIGSETGSGEDLVRRHPFQIGMGPGALTVDTANQNHIQIDIVAVALNADGKVLKDLTQQIDAHLKPADLDHLRNTGFIYSNAVELAPETTRVRFIVRDDLSDRVGTVSVPIVFEGSRIPSQSSR